MAVTCVQVSYFTIDSPEVAVTYLIEPPVAGWTDQQLLDWKADRHQADGWTVEWAQNRRSFNAAKDYPPVAEQLVRKQRTFRRAG